MADLQVERNPFGSFHHDRGVAPVEKEQARNAVEDLAFGRVGLAAHLASYTLKRFVFIPSSRDRAEPMAFHDHVAFGDPIRDDNLRDNRSGALMNAVDAEGDDADVVPSDRGDQIAYGRQEPLMTIEDLEKTARC